VNAEVLRVELEYTMVGSLEYCEMRAIDPLIDPALEIH
jgi:hypothetical protein